MMEAVCQKCSRVMMKMQSGFSVSNYPALSVKPIVQRGDLFECPECHNQIFASFGSRDTACEGEPIVWVT